jgi:hypothetical protein
LRLCAFALFFSLRSCVSVSGLSAGYVWEKTEPGIGSYRIFQLALHAVDHNQSDFIQIQTNPGCKIADFCGHIDLYRPAARLSWKQLTEQFNID